MIEIKFTKNNRSKALRYLCTNGYLSPSDPYCTMIANLLASEGITNVCYESAGRTVNVVIEED